MAIKEGEQFMGKQSPTSPEHSRFNLFHRGGEETVKLPDGTRMPVVKDINSFTTDVLEQGAEKQRQERLIQGRKPLMGGLKRVLTGIVNGTVRS